MSFPRDAYPYTNFHELNLGYFIVHFREIFSQWADLYDQMLDWKDATTDELAAWKTGVEADLDQREAALRAELETWKAQTGQDIAGWENATLAALTAWQTATQAVFEAIRVEAAGSATAAAASAGDAATAKTAAETAQAAAEAAAASIASSAAQIATNTADISDLKTQLSDIVESYGSILPYLYKRNVYLNDSGVETPLNNCDLYFVPLAKYEHIEMVWNPQNSFYQGINARYVFHTLNADDTITSIVNDTGNAEYYFNTVKGQCTLVNRTGYKGIYISTVRGNESSLSVFAVNQTGAVLNEYKKSFPVKIEKNGKFSSNNIYFRSDNKITFDPNLNINGVKFHVIPGDKLVFENTVSGLTYRGVLFYDNNYITISTNVTEYTVENEGIYCAIVLDSNPELTTMYIPKNRTKVLYEDVLNTPKENDAYKGKKGVAFGTSLTYRGQEGQTGGYLNYLPALSGMTWDNQGLGSASILAHPSLPQMLPKITDYTEYTDKDICILEGFVNDWYYNANTLGTWKDTGTTTVCGCVRYALNYIFSQNTDITIFLLLDHIGKNVSVDCSSLAENAGNKTQSEYYDEIAKVAESMGVHVIKEYAESEISENTPQYLRDNIHLTMLGAEQSANTIWACMKKYVPNVVSV